MRGQSGQCSTEQSNMEINKFRRTGNKQSELNRLTAPEYKPKHKSNHLPLVIFLAFVLLSSAYFIGPGFTGFFIAEPGLVNYSQDMSWSIDSNSSLNFTLDQHPEAFDLRTLTASGSYLGNGSVRAYLEHDGVKYLLLDSSTLEPETLAPVTGFTVVQTDTAPEEAEPDYEIVEEVIVDEGVVVDVPEQLVESSEPDSDVIEEVVDENISEEPVVDENISEIIESIENITEVNITVEENITEVIEPLENITEVNITIEENFTEPIIDENITIVNITDINITELNITNITDINVTELNITDTNITELNITNITDTNITELNITNITDINVTIIDITNITELNISDINITENVTDEVDVSEEINLTVPELLSSYRNVKLLDAEFSIIDHNGWGVIRELSLEVENLENSSIEIGVVLLDVEGYDETGRYAIDPVIVEQGISLVKLPVRFSYSSDKKRAVKVRVRDSSGLIITSETFVFNPKKALSVKEFTFNAVCADTCILPANLTDSSYNFVFEIDSGVLDIDSVSYVLKNLSVPINITNVTIDYELSIKDSEGVDVVADVEFLDNVTEELKFKKPKKDKKISVDKGKYKVRIVPENKKIKEVVFNDIEIVDNVSDELFLEDVPEFDDYVQVYAIDPSQINFTNGSLTATAKGTQLFKCKDWNFSTQTCFGKWAFLRTITPGMDYTIELSPEDPALAEIGGIFFDDFEDGSMDNWTSVGSYADWFIYDINAPNGTYSAFCEPNGGIEYLEVEIDTSGYENITVAYKQRDAGLDDGEYCGSDYWEGTGWTEIDQREIGFTVAVLSFDLPSDADDNSAFKLRLKSNSDKNNEKCWIDDVRVSGDEIPVADSQAPTFDVIPANASLEYLSESLSVDYDASDVSGIDSYFINDTGNFAIDTSGTLTNATSLSMGIYHINVSVNDTYNNVNFTTFQVVVEDTIAPASVSSLVSQSVGDYWIYWTWSEPGDSDFAASIVYINGSNDLNQSSGSNYYNKTGLSCGTTLNITVHTKDNSGNVNSANVVNISETSVCVVDSQAPTFDVIPANATLEFAIESLNVDYDASDASDIDSYFINDSSFSINNSGGLTNATSLSIGTYHINVSVNDTYNNVNFTTFQVVVEDSSIVSSVSDLTSPVSGTSWIYWNWSEPVDSDFNSSIIFIDGVNIVNLSQGTNYYNYTGLLSNTSYTITVHTMDDFGVINNTDQNSSDSTANVNVYETGIVEDVNGWTTVTLNKSYIYPVVVVTPLDGYELSADIEVSTAIVRSVTTTSFEVQLYNESYGSVVGDVGYVVVESGSHMLSNGMLLQAGLSTGVDSYNANGDDVSTHKSITYPISYSSAPVVIASPNKDSAQDWVAVRYETGTLASSGVELSLELDQSYGTAPIVASGIGDGTNNSIGWIVMNRTSVSDMESALESAVDEDPDAADWRAITFSNSYDNPVFFAVGEENTGTDSTTVGRNNLNSTGVQIRRTEERTDGEQTHATEDTVWMVFEAMSIPVPPTPPSINITWMNITPDDDDITPGSQINPLESSNITVSVLANLTNASAVDTCSVTIFNSTDSYASPSLTSVGSVFVSDTQTQCNVSWDMSYWRNSDNYSVVLDVNLSDSTIDQENSSFFYNVLTSHTLNLSSILWSGQPGVTVDSSNAFPLGIENTGNKKINISISGTDFIGVDPTFNFSISNASYSSTSDGSYTSIASSPIQIVELDNIGPQSIEELFFQGIVPLGMKAQEYNNTISIQSS